MKYIIPTFASSSLSISPSHILPSFMSFFVVVITNLVQLMLLIHACMHVGTSTELWKPTSGLVGTSSRTNDRPPYPLCIVNISSVWGGVWRLLTPPMLQLLKYLRKGTMVPLYFAFNSYRNGNTISSKLRILSSSPLQLRMENSICCL